MVAVHGKRLVRQIGLASNRMGFVASRTHCLSEHGWAKQGESIQVQCRVFLFANITGPLSLGRAH